MKQSIFAFALLAHAQALHLEGGATTANDLVDDKDPNNVVIFEETTTSADAEAISKETNEGRFGDRVPVMYAGDDDEEDDDEDDEDEDDNNLKCKPSHDEGWKCDCKKKEKKSCGRYDNDGCYKKKSCDKDKWSCDDNWGSFDNFGCDDKYGCDDKWGCDDNWNFDTNWDYNGHNDCNDKNHDCKSKCHPEFTYLDDIELKKKNYRYPVSEKTILAGYLRFIVDNKKGHKDCKV